MEKQKRQKKILEFIRANSAATVADLCESFQVSEMTIRRDLAELDEAGLLRRVHGGATLGTGRSNEPTYRARALENHEAKQAIAALAASLVADGDSIALDVGTTIHEMVSPLKDRLDLTILTPSLSIANSLLEVFRPNSGMRLMLTGGIVRQDEKSLIGEYAQSMYHNLNVDKAFLGVGALNIKEGFTEYNLDDAAVKKAMLGSAEKVYFLADGSKFGRSTFASVAPLSTATAILTDSSAPQAIISQIQAMGVEVIVAPSPLP